MTNIKSFPLASTILAAARDGTMKAEEIQHTITALSELLLAQASEDTNKKQRIAKMQAAMVDPKFNPIVARVTGELKRLGFDSINAFAEEAGNLKKLDAAMTDANMEVGKRMQLKTNLHAIGLI